MAGVVEALKTHERRSGQRFEHAFQYTWRRHRRGRTIAELAATIYETATPTDAQRRSVLRAVRSLEDAGTVVTRRVGIGERERKLRRPYGRGATVHGIEVVLGDFD